MKKIFFLFLATAFVALPVSGTTRSHDTAPMTLWYDRPAQFFEESLPIGNGKLGALVYGDPKDDVLFLNDITLWTGQPVDQQEDAGACQWIPRIREALFKEDYRLADSLQLHVQGHNSQFYQPLATLRLRADSGHVDNYRRELSLDSSLVKISYLQDGIRFSREYFASAPDKVIAIRLTADRPASINTEIVLTSQVPHHVKASAQQITLTGHAIGDERQSIHFCANLIPHLKGGSLKQTDSTLVVTDADELVLYFVNETSFNGARRHPVTQAAPYIENVADDAWHLVNYTYEQLRERHISDYRHYYARMCLRLGKDERSDDRDMLMPTDQLLKQYSDGRNSSYLESLYFQFGRYLLISSSRTPGVPANLQGLWTPHKWSPWRGNYTMNINLEENYWPAFVCNLAEMAEPLDSFVEALAENGRHTARHYYGIERGWCASHNSDIWAMTNPVGEKNEMPEWANWNMGGAWLVNTLWERFLFTQDKKYLHKVMPLMTGAAEFCREWLIPNPKRPEELITAPSTSPENEYVNDSGYHGMTCYGGTADLAIIRELLLNTQQALRVVSPDADATITCQQLMQTVRLLHPYTIGQGGDLNEWYYDWDDKDIHHRHQSHLIGLYPGQHYLRLDLLKDANPSELSRNDFMIACRRTLEMKGDQTTGWSTGWRINLWARLNDGEQAYRIYRKLLTFVSPDGYEGPDKRRSGGTYPNLFDAHPPFQIDGNFGGTAGVCEMLVQSSVDTHGTANICLLPALPKAWADGCVKGLCARGGFLIDMTWSNGRVDTVCVSSRSGGKALVSYNGKTIRMKLKAGKSKTLK